MSTTSESQQDFVASFALQRQRLLHHVGSVLAADSAAEGDAATAVATLSPVLMTSLELLKVAEEELLEERRTNATRQAIQDRRLQHLTAMFDLAPAPLMLTTTDTTIREMNQAAASFFGRDAYSMSGMQLSQMVSKAQQATFREQLALALEIGRVETWSFTLDLQRSGSAAVVATVQQIDDAAVGARALYWNIRAV